MSTVKDIFFFFLVQNMDYNNKLCCSKYLPAIWKVDAGTEIDNLAFLTKMDAKEDTKSCLVVLHKTGLIIITARPMPTGRLKIEKEDPERNLKKEGIKWDIETQVDTQPNLREVKSGPNTSKKFSKEENANRVKRFTKHTNSRKHEYAIIRSTKSQGSNPKKLQKVKETTPTPAKSFPQPRFFDNTRERTCFKKRRIIPPISSKLLQAVQERDHLRINQKLQKETT